MQVYEAVEQKVSIIAEKFINLERDVSINLIWKLYPSLLKALPRTL